MWATMRDWWRNHHYWCRGVCTGDSYHEFRQPIHGRRGTVIWHLKCRICGKTWTNMMPP